jgi:hypothetical protein
MLEEGHYKEDLCIDGRMLKWNLKRVDWIYVACDSAFVNTAMDLRALKNAKNFWGS